MYEVLFNSNRKDLVDNLCVFLLGGGLLVVEHSWEIEFLILLILVVLHFSASSILGLDDLYAYRYN